MSDTHQEIINKIKPELDKVMQFLEGEMAKIRTGRATPSLVEDVVVDCFGQKFPLKQLAAISCPEPKQILIQPWDKSYIEGIVFALQKTGVGANPIVDKDAVRINLPTLTRILEVREKEVSEAKNIILFSDNLNLTAGGSLTKGTEDLWFSPDEKKIILLEEDNEEDKWSLKLYDLDKNIKSHLISETDIHPRGADLMNLQFSDDSKEIYLDVGIKEQEKYFTLKLDKFPPQLTERKISPPPENILASQKINNDSYYLDNSGYVFKDEVKLNEKPFPVQPETEYELEVFPNFVFLKEGQNLFLLNTDTKSGFEEFFDGAKLLKVSPDKEKIVYFSDWEIWILFLKDKPAELVKKAGKKLFLLRLSEQIGDCFWLNNNYLLFNSGDKIKISEIDERDKINIIDIAEIKNPRIIWNKTNEKLYVLSEGTLYESPKLLP